MIFPLTSVFIHYLIKKFFSYLSSFSLVKKIEKKLI